VNMTVSAATPGIPADPRVQPLIGKFLSLLEKSYFVRSEGNFTRLFEAFFEDVDAFFDDLRIDGQGLISSSQEAELDSNDLRELEEFIDEHSKKGKK